MSKKNLIAVLMLAALHGSLLAQETIKVGLLNVDAGAFATNASKVTDAAIFAVETLNAQGGALGRKYQLVTQLHSGSPAATAAAASKLVEQQGVTFFAGLNSSAMSLAIAPKLTTLNALFIDSTSASDELTGKGCQPNYFRVSATDSAMINTLREPIAQSGIKTWSSLMVDFAAGHDFSKAITALVQESGGTMQQTLFAPLATTDFGGYISQLAAKPTEGLVAFMAGAAGITLGKQQAQFGLFQKYKMVLAHNSFTNELYVTAQGDTTAGTITAQSYLASMPGETNAAFVKAYEARFKRKPSYIEADVYLSYALLHAAIVKAKSTDVAAVRAALSGLKTQSIVGDIEMRAGDHQLVRPMALVQVNKIAEGKAEVVLKTVEPASKAMSPVSSECKMGA